MYMPTFKIMIQRIVFINKKYSIFNFHILLIDLLFSNFIERQINQCDQ